MSSILEFCRDIPVRDFDPGAILLAEGEKSGLLYVLADGEVEGDFDIVVLRLLRSQ